MITVFEETRERSTRKNNTAECKDSLLKDWIVCRGRPRLIRMDPDTLCTMTLESTPKSSLEKHPGDCPSHRSHHETGEQDRSHLRVGSGTCGLLSGMPLASGDGTLSSSQTWWNTLLYSFSSATNRR